MADDRKKGKNAAPLPDLYDPVEDEDDGLDESEDKKAGRKKGLFATMRSLLKRAPAPAPAVPTGKQAIEPMQGEEDHWVSLSLEQLLTQDPSALVHIISLRAFRQALGPVWERIATKVLMIAEGTLRQHAGPLAKIQQNGPDVFLIMFNSLSPEAGRRRAFDISVVLGKKLVGAKFQIVGSGGALGIGLVSLPASALLGEDGQLAADALDQAAEAAPQVSDTAEAGVWMETVGKVEIDPNFAPVSRGDKAYKDNTWLKFKVSQPKPEIRLVPIEPPKKKVGEPEWVPIRKDR